MVKRIERKVFYGPSSYSSGGVYERFGSVADIDAVFDLFTDSGYSAYPVSTEGNQIKYKVFWQTGASGESMVEIAEGENISDAMFEAQILAE